MSVARSFDFPGANMTTGWSQFLGQRVDGKFELRELLDATDKSAVFVTDQGGQLKLLSTKAKGMDELARSWRFAHEVSHPNLIHVHETGVWNPEGHHFLYAVMERGEFNLAQLLLERPLTPAETEEMVRPLTSVLGYLHSKGLVLGDVRPESVMVIQDQLKFNSESIVKARQKAFGDNRGVYEAPEVPSDGFTAASDVWALGVTVHEAVTQKAPEPVDLSMESVSLPTDVPAAIREIVLNCLKRDPARRWTVSEIQARLDGQMISAKKPKLEIVAPPSEQPQSEAKRPTPDKAPVLDVANSQKQSTQPISPVKLSGLWRYVALGVIVLALIVGWRTLRKSSSDTAQTAISSEVQTAAPASEQPSTSERNVPARPDAPPTIVRQVIPDIPRSASATISGTIKVKVRVSTDASGKVSDAALESAGPSKYFARKSLEAARQWEFSASAGAQTIQFEFRHDSTNARLIAAK